MTETTTIVIAYRTSSLDLSYLEADDRAVVVHNDDVLAPETVTHPNIVHLTAAGNIGFGAAVNRALQVVDTERVILANPDLTMTREAWRSVAEGAPNEVTTLALVDPSGVQTSVVAPYPTPLSLSLTAWRAGRLAPRSLRRHLPRWMLGAWTSQQTALLDRNDVSLPLATHWVSGAVLGVDTDRFRSVNGFDDAYFLYLEDTDLCARLARRYPDMQARVVRATGVHQVGASSRDATERRLTDRHYADSALRYAERFEGWSGALVRAIVHLRRLTLR